MHPKHHIHKNSDYLGWIREKPCLTCGELPRSQCHHVWHSGKKNHGNDYLAIPLCGMCHTSGSRAYHVLGHSRFEEVWNVDLKDEIINLMGEYLEGK